MGHLGGGCEEIVAINSPQGGGGGGGGGGREMDWERKEIIH